MFCPNCGNNIPDDSKFCPVCGSVYEQQAPVPQGQQEGNQAKKQGDKLHLIQIILAAVATGFLIFNLNKFPFTWMSFLGAAALLVFAIINKFYKYDQMLMAIPLTVFWMRYFILDVMVLFRVLSIHYTFGGIWIRFLLLSAVVMYWLMTTVFKNKRKTLFSLIEFGLLLLIFVYFRGNNNMEGGFRFYALDMVKYGIGMIAFSASYLLLFLLDQTWLDEEIAWIKSWFKKKPAQQAAPVQQSVPNQTEAVPAQGSAFCPVCGKPMDAGSKFCMFCGTRVE